MSRRSRLVAVITTCVIGGEADNVSLSFVSDGHYTVVTSLSVVLCARIDGRGLS